MAGGNGGGIGRFASRKKNISQPDVPPATVARADGPRAGGRPDDDDATADAEGGEPAPANDDAVVVDAASAAAMEAERTSEDFISLGYDNDGGGGRLATQYDSNDFSSIGQMFGNNDDAMDADDGNVGDIFLSSTPADYASFGQGYDGEYQVFEGFEQGSPMGEERAESPAKGNDYITGEIGADSHPAVHAQTLLTLATTAAAPTGIGGGGTAEGGGIGLFSKKRIIATAATATAQQPNGHREHQYQHSNVAGAGVNSVEDMSVSNLSRFDVDLMSKNTDNAIPAMTATSSVGARGNVLAGNEECDGVEVPSTIRMSDDDDGDLDDDLTEATASNFAAKEGEGERSKTITVFSRPSNDQTEAQGAQEGLANDVFHQNVPMQASNFNARPPREDIAIPRITDATIDQQPSSKFGTSNEASITRGLMEVSKPTKKRGNGGVLMPNQSLAPRVSLSPHPGMNDENRASSRPSLNAANQACLFSPIANANDDADDDNGIVIPGVPAAKADEDANTGTALQTEFGGGLIGTINNPPRNPPASTMSKFSTSLLNRQRSSLISSKNGIGKFSTSTEKVQFAAPETRPSAMGATKTVDSSNSLVGTSLANSNALSKFAAAASGSTAITPDHRQSGVKESAATSFSRSTNDSGGDAITPAFHETPTTAQALAGTMQYDSTHNDRFVPEIPTATAGPKAMEVEPQVEDPIEARRPRSNAICSPPPPTNKESVTPKASNVNPPFTIVNTNDVLGQSYLKTNSAFHTDETFDELLSQFVNDIQDGTDIFERGQNDLLELDVDLSHAFAAVLRYKDDYTNLLGEIEGVMAMAECIMSEVTS